MRAGPKDTSTSEWRVVFVLLFLAIAVGAGSLGYPLGRDQALGAYVGRAWIYRGAVPYRDLFDDQMIGVYMIHALASLFGAQAGVRIVDLAFVLGLGAVAATFATDSDERSSPSLLATGALAAAILHYGFLGFWDTAQPDTWASASALAAIASARKIAKQPRAAVVSAMLVALAILVKLASLPLAAAALAILVVRGKRDGRMAATLIPFVGTVVVIFGAVAASLAAVGALGPALTILVDCGGYLARETSVHGAGDLLHVVLTYYRSYAPVSPLVVGASVALSAIHHRRGEHRERNRILFGSALWLLAFAGVVLGRRFFYFHWNLCLGPSTVLVVDAARSVAGLTRSLLPPSAGRNARCAAIAIAVTSFLVAEPARRWRADTTALFARTTTEARFALPMLRFSATDAEAVARWIDSHSLPADSVVVRGFDPEIYVLADRYADDRFFWTTFLTSPARTVFQRRWQVDDAAALDAHPPAIVVAVTDAAIGPDAPSTFEARGYVQTSTIGAFTILERR